MLDESNEQSGDEILKNTPGPSSAPRNSQQAWVQDQLVPKLSKGKSTKPDSVTRSGSRNILGFTVVIQSKESFPAMSEAG